MWERRIRRELWVAHNVRDGIVGQERGARIRHHAEQGRRESTEEVAQARLRGDFLDDMRGRGGDCVGRVMRRRPWRLGVYLAHDAGEAAALRGLCFECKTHADDFEGICAEYTNHASQTAADEAAARGFLGFTLDYACADLLVCEEFDTRIREDAEKGRRVAFEKSAHAGGGVDVVHGGGEARP